LFFGFRVRLRVRRRTRVDGGEENSSSPSSSDNDSVESFSGIRDRFKILIMIQLNHFSGIGIASLRFEILIMIPH